MFSGDDPASHEQRSLEESNVIGCSMVHRKPKGQIKIAVIKGSIPTDADLMAAHQAIHGLGIERSL
jgi:hypothetical protein